MRTEFFVGSRFDRNGEPLQDVPTLQAKGDAMLSLEFGGFTRLEGVGGEVGKPDEPTTVWITSADSLTQAENAAQYLREVFNQRSVFFFYGVESHLVEKGG